MNVLFIGDVHLSPRTPSSRKDDYPETILNKLLSLKQLITDHDIKHLVFLGDLFNTKNMTLPYFIKCFQVFKELNDTGVRMHLVVGNHDIYYNNDSTLEESPIQLLLDSNLFNHEPFTEDGVYFNLIGYTTNTQNVPPVTEVVNYNILIGHYFFNLGFGDEEHTLSKDQCSSLGYDSYILGHDHVPYDPVILKKYQVHRPGSLSRGTSHTCQINRDGIKVLLFNTGTKQYTYLDLPNVQPTTEVFKEVTLVSKVSMLDIDESLKDLLASLDFDNSSDILETLEGIEMNPKVREVVYSYLSDVGVYLKKEDHG